METIVNLKISPQYFYRPESWGGILIHTQNGQKIAVDPNMAAMLNKIGFRGLNLKASEADLFNAPFLIREGVITSSSVETKSDLKSPPTTKDEISLVPLENALDVPLTVSIYPQMACPQRCSFCFVSKDKRVPSVVSLDRWQSLIDEMINLKIPYLSVLGGEPLIFEDTLKILEYANSVSQSTHVTTSGYKIKAGVAERISRLEKLNVTVSLHGEDQVHDQITGGSAQSTKEFIKALIAHGKTPTIHLTGVKEVLEGGYSFLDWASQVGVRKISLGSYQPLGDQVQPKVSIEKSREILGKWKLYSASRGYSLMFGLEACLGYSTVSHPKKLPNSRLSKIVSGCQAGRTSIEVLADGTVIPCVAFARNDGYCGNILQTSLKEIWQTSKVLDQIRSLDGSMPGCEGCPYCGFCRGGCPARVMKTGKKDSLCEWRPQNV